MWWWWQQYYYISFLTCFYYLFAACFYNEIKQPDWRGYGISWLKLYNQSLLVSKRKKIPFTFVRSLMFIAMVIYWYMYLSDQAKSKWDNRVCSWWPYCRSKQWKWNFFLKEIVLLFYSSNMAAVCILYKTGYTCFLDQLKAWKVKVWLTYPRSWQVR